VFLLHYGGAKLVRSSPNGKDCIVALRLDSWFLGACDVVIGTDFQVTAVTLVPSLLSRISGDDFLRRLHEEREFSKLIHEQHCRENRAQLLRSAELMTVPASECLLRLLWRLASSSHVETLDVGTQFDLPLRQWELAQMVGVAEQTLSKLINKLVADRAILRVGRRFTLLRRPG
jgi:CRP-like cAMP-binding protein